MTLLTGDGGVGKSTLALQLHWACATGKPWLGMQVKQRPSLYVSCEDPLREIHYRVEQFHDAELMSAPNLDKLHILDFSTKDALMGEIDPETRRLVMTSLFRQIEMLVLEIGVGLVTFDASADVFGGDEINRTQVRAFIAGLRGLSVRRTCASILIAHPSVDAMTTGRGYSGSTAWNNSVRSRLSFTKPLKGDDGEDLDPNIRKLELPKSNRGPGGLEKQLRWEDGRFVPQNREFNDMTKQIGDEDLFMRLLDQFTREGRNVSAHTSRTYAPTEFAKHPLGKTVSVARFRHAMDVLFSVGKICTVEFGPPSKPRSKLVRVEDNA